MNDLVLRIEAIIFAAGGSVSVTDVFESLQKSISEEPPTLEEVEEAAGVLLTKYNDEHYPFEVVKVGGGYQFLTKSTHHKTIAVYQNLKSKRKLSTAAMETLSIIAYRQPVTKSVIENIRGVNCDYSIQKLLEKELVSITGRADSPGKPLLYGTSPVFMDYFGINSMDDLPKLKEFETEGQEVGVSPDLLDREIEPQQGEASDHVQTDEDADVMKSEKTEDSSVLNALDKAAEQAENENGGTNQQQDDADKGASESEQPGE